MIQNHCKDNLIAMTVYISLVNSFYNLIGSIINLIKSRNNFTKGYRTICRFEINVLNYQTSQTNVSKFPNVSRKGTRYRTISRFAKKVLNYQTSQISVSKLPNVSRKDTALGFTVNPAKIPKIPFFNKKTKSKKMLGFRFLSEFNRIWKNTHT
jgi:hypothetical protein